MLAEKQKNRPRVIGVGAAVDDFVHYTTGYDCFAVELMIDRKSGDVWSEVTWTGNERPVKYENEPEIIRLFDFVREYLGIEPTINEDAETDVTAKNVYTWANLCARMCDAMQKQEADA